MAIGHLVRKPNLVGLKLRVMEFAVTKNDFFAFLCKLLDALADRRAFRPTQFSAKKKNLPRFRFRIGCMYNGQVSTRLHHSDSELQPPQSSSRDHGNHSTG